MGDSCGSALNLISECVLVHRGGEGSGGDGAARGAPAAGAPHAGLQRPAGQGALRRPPQQHPPDGGRAPALCAAVRLPTRMVGRVSFTAARKLLLNPFVDLIRQV